MLKSELRNVPANTHLPSHRKVLLICASSLNLGKELFSEKVLCRQGMYVRGTINSSLPLSGSTQERRSCFVAMVELRVRLEECTLTLAGTGGPILVFHLENMSFSNGQVSIGNWMSCSNCIKAELYTYS